MITTCQFIGIYPEAIENMEDEITNELEKLDIEFEYEQDEIYDELKLIGNWESITNSIISVLCYIGENLVYSQYPNAKVETYINGYDSSFSINNIEELLEDEKD